MRTMTCDKCGVGINPNDPPVTLSLPSTGTELHIDLCSFCQSNLRMDWLVRLDEWREALDDEEEDDDADAT